MEKRLIDSDFPFVANHQATEVAEPGDGSFDLPSFAISSQWPAILSRRSLSSFPMRADQFNATLCQSQPVGIGVVSTVRDQSLGLRRFATSIMRRHHSVIECGLQQRHFRRRGRCQTDADRNSLAVRHHHALCSLAAFRLADAFPPFFAGKKLASTKASSQLSQPASSRSARNVRHTSTHTSCSSQSRSRRQHVLGDGYRSGRSCQRAPLCRIQRMPSSTRRFSIGLRPPLGVDLACGNNGSMIAQRSSFKNGFTILAISATPFAQNDLNVHKFNHGASLQKNEF